MSVILEADRQAQWAVRAEQGAQPRRNERQWAAKTVRHRLHPEEYAAAQRLLRDCMPAFEGASAGGERVDCDNGAEYRLVRQVDARRSLEIAKIAVSLRAQLPGCHACLECLARGESLSDVARAMRYMRQRRERLVPNVEMAANGVQIVLAALAEFYGDNVRRVGFSAAA